MADIERGYRVESVTTNVAFSYEMPQGATEYEQWRLRGGRETYFALDFGDFAFPLGTNMVRRVRVLSGGTIETYRALNASAAICAANEWASLVPGVSRFWSSDEDGAKVLTWEDVFANRDGTGGYSAQVRLFANGDFAVRSNDVETVCVRVNPDDWDGDGLANDIDPSPMQYDGDFFGTSVALYNANCSGVLHAATNALGETEITWNASANPDAYYWLDLSATGVVGVTTIRVTCDGPSDLGDMTIVARTNMVCHIPMLAGAEYSVASDLPIGHSAVSSEYAVIATNSENRLSVSLPIELSFERIAMRGGGTDSYSPSTSPVDVAPQVVAVSGGCCACETNAWGFAWTCAPGCSCGEWHGLLATAAWAGYSRPFNWAGWCPCAWHDGSGQGTRPAHLVLSMPTTLFTNNDGGAEDSDIVRLTAGLFSPEPANGTLELVVCSGDVAKVWTTSNRMGRVEAREMWNVADAECRVFFVEGAGEAARGGGTIGLTWRGEDGRVLLSTNICFAVYYPVANVVNASLYDNGDLCNQAAIVTGTNACFALEFGAVHPPPGEIVWSVVGGSAAFVGGNTGERVRVASSVPGQLVTLRARVADCRSRPVEMSAYVVDPLSVKLTAWIVGNNDGSYYATDAQSVSNMVAGVNKIYEQVGVSFYVDSICYTNKRAWLDISKDNGERCDPDKRRELVNIARDTGGFELYFIDKVTDLSNASNDAYGIVVSTNATAKALSHEIGHAFGCADVYHVLRRNGRLVRLPDSSVLEERLPHDWSNGTGCRYYAQGCSLDRLIRRLLMCGFDYPDSVDIPAGSIHGFTKHGDAGLVDTGFFRNGSRRTPRFHR